MLIQIRALFAAPIFEDEGKTRIARLLHVVLLTLLAATVLMVIMALMSIGFPSNMEEAFTPLAGMLLIVAVFGGLVLAHRGHLRVPSVVLLFLLWVVTFYWIYNFGGGISGDTSTLIYVLIIVLAGLLLGKRAAVICTAFSLLAILGMFYAESTGMVLVSGRPATFFDLVFIILPIGLTGMLLSYAVHNMDQALEHVRHNELTLAESNRELQSVRKSLEQRNECLRATVQKYVEYMAVAEQGDMTTRLDLDEVGWLDEDDPLLALGGSMNRMVAAMQDILRQIRNAVHNLSSSAAEILAATTQQASGASEQSAAIAQTTTTVDELKTIAEQSVARAQEVAGASQRTVDVSHAGRQAVQETIGSMAQIKGQVEGIAENILALAEQMQQIGEIIATVNDIAAQSNILALNASVEAARAGEYGKGFAVVAVEVRNLSEQSRQATAQVRAILSDIQKATNATVMTTEEGTKGVDEGVRLAAQAQEAIVQLTAVIEESAQASMQVVAGGRQQAAGVEQVALAMQSINQATVQSLESTRQAEKAARDINELADSLIAIVEQYRL